MLNNQKELFDGKIEDTLEISLFIAGRKTKFDYSFLYQELQHRCVRGYRCPIKRTSIRSRHLPGIIMMFLHKKNLDITKSRVSMKTCQSLSHLRMSLNIKF